MFKIIKTFNQVTTNPEFVDPIVMEATIQRSNNNIEQTFHLFWSELVLKCLPQNIIHYPSVKVISLDVRAMLIELVYQPHAFKSVEDDDYDEALIMKNGNNNMNFSNHGNENKIMNYSDSNFDDMDFDEFLAFYKEQVRTSEDILSLFYYDFFTEKSPVFNDILKRHAKIIDNWAY